MTSCSRLYSGARHRGLHLLLSCNAYDNRIKGCVILRRSGYVRGEVCCISNLLVLTYSIQTRDIRVYVRLEVK